MFLTMCVYALQKDWVQTKQCAEYTKIAQKLTDTIDVQCSRYSVTLILSDNLQTDSNTFECGLTIKMKAADMKHFKCIDEKDLLACCVDHCHRQTLCKDTLPIGSTLKHSPQESPWMQSRVEQRSVSWQFCLLIRLFLGRQQKMNCYICGWSCAHCSSKLQSWQS